MDEVLAAEAAAALDLEPAPALPVTVSSSPEAELAPSGPRSGLAARTKRWLAASVGVAAGVGIGAWVAVTVPSGSGVEAGRDAADRNG